MKPRTVEAQRRARMAQEIREKQKALNVACLMWGLLVVLFGARIVAALVGSAK